MTAYFDEKNREVIEASKGASPEVFLRRLEEIEGVVLNDVSYCCGDREFPDDLRERIMGICATRSVCRKVSGAELLPSKGAVDYATVTRSSLFLEDLHSAFHAVARERIRTRFGLLSDDPRGNVQRRDDHDSQSGRGKEQGATEIEGVLQIDHERGVIYFHDSKTGFSVLRICSLPTPIPQFESGKGVNYDLTHMVGVNWSCGQVQGGSSR